MNKELIVVSPFTYIGQDERGTTAEILLERTGKALSIFRKKDAVFGNHYHTGSQATKNPEIFWLLHGELKFKYRHIDSKEWIVVDAIAPVKIDIYPNVLHRVTAVTDSYMLELNSLQEHIDDTRRSDE
jgi:hypothetical protein